MTNLPLKAILGAIHCALVAILCSAGGLLASAAGAIPDTFVIPILVIHYFPTNGANLDLRVTGDVGGSLEAIREKTQRQTREAMAALEAGSCYRAFLIPSTINHQPSTNPTPTLRYQVAGSREFLEPLPTWAKPGHKTPMTDYRQILDRVNIKDWVEHQGVKEVWIWGYHGGKVDLWESNLSSPFGDVSNSDRDPQDLPVLDKTYTVYHYNYQRGTSEAIEDHIHQIEAVLNHFDGRDRTPPDKWPGLLFWGHFVGSDRTHKIVHPGCGWAHYPPNAEHDYDWANPRFVETDMDDWQPDGSGKKTRMNCDRWGGNSLRWFVYWMQHLPGPANGLTFEGKPLQNWWVFIADFDLAKTDIRGI
jgi:hypothetical protein